MMWWLIRQELNREHTTFSRILERADRMDMGRKLLGFDGSPDLWIGVITATLHASGKGRLDMDEL